MADESYCTKVAGRVEARASAERTSTETPRNKPLPAGVTQAAAVCDSHLDSMQAVSPVKRRGGRQAGSALDSAQARAARALVPAATPAVLQA